MHVYARRVLCWRGRGRTVVPCTQDLEDLLLSQQAVAKCFVRVVLVVCSVFLVSGTHRVRHDCLEMFAMVAGGNPALEASSPSQISDSPLCSIAWSTLQLPPCSQLSLGRQAPIFGLLPRVASSAVVF